MDFNDETSGESLIDSQSRKPGTPKVGRKKIAISKASQPLAKKKQQSPQEALEDFWATFLSKNPGKVSVILPPDVYEKKAGKNTPKGTIKEENALASYDEAARICKEKVDKIIEECRRVNCKYSDPDFDIEFDLKYATRNCLDMLDNGSYKRDGKPLNPGSVRRVGDIFDDPKFFINGATPNDVRQGHVGDCWFLAAVCALGNIPSLIEKICVAKNEERGVYGFVFFRDGEWRPEVIDDKLYLIHEDYHKNRAAWSRLGKERSITTEEEYRKIYQRNSRALYFAQCEDPNETWLPLLEKAYAKAHGDYDATCGGQQGEALEDLTGSVALEIFARDIFDKEYFWNERLLKVNKDFFLNSSCKFHGGDKKRNGIVRDHSYSINRAVEVDGQRLLLLRNPWGFYEWDGPWSDGSKEWTPEMMEKLNHRFGDDGDFWLQKYQNIHCVRLLTVEWESTQKWISLNVPWVLDYHRTKFLLTLEKTSPVVLVLSQLDTRYFKGLQGKYYFKLSFAVQKFGEQDHIVSSHPVNFMRRSVSADFTLEAGEYQVLMKIETTRTTHSSVEEVVRRYAEERPAKLMQVALQYDLAHAKVREEDRLEEKKAKNRAEKTQLNELKKQLKEKLMKSKKRQKHVENKEKRKKRAAKAKKLAKAKAKAAKATEEKAKSSAAASKVDAAVQTREGPLQDLEDKLRVVSDIVTSTNAEPTDLALGPAAPAPQPDAEDESVSDPTLPPTSKAGKKERHPKKSGPEQQQKQEEEDEEEEDDDDSDLESDVSDMSSGTVDEQFEARIEGIKRTIAAKGSPPIDPPHDDDIEPGYWNPVVIVGLRVYSKENGISIGVMRPHDPVIEGKIKEAEIWDEDAKLQETAIKAMAILEEKRGGVTGGESDGESVMDLLSDS